MAEVKAEQAAKRLAAGKEPRKTFKDLQAEKLEAKTIKAEAVAAAPNPAQVVKPMKPADLFGEYMGGHPAYPRKSFGGLSLVIQPSGISLDGMTSKKKGLIRLAPDEIIDIQVTADPSSAKRAAGAKIALGVLALATSKRVTECYVIVSSVDGDIIMHIKKPPMQVQAQIAPYVALFTRQTTAAAPPPAADSVPEQIAKLAELRNAGILTEDEFAAKKTELLNRM